MNIFIFYIAATFRSRCSLMVFCIKVVLRLDLVHSKYIGNIERIWQWIKSLLLSQLGKQFYLVYCSGNFWNTHRKNPIDFPSTSSSKKEPLLRGILVNFLNAFQNSFFYKSLLISSFWILLYYLVFQEITFVTSVVVNVVKKYNISHNLEK